MPSYSAPGVYVEETPSDVAPIEGVGTSTGGFIGYVADDIVMPADPSKPAGEDGNPALHPVAPAGHAVLVTSWVDFTERFGEITPDKNDVLARGVQGFFLNGGSRCWVARLAAALTGDDVGAALGEFEKIDEICLVAVPGATDATVQEKVIAHCETLTDRFAILDATANADELTGAGVLPSFGRTSPFCAAYFPWLDVGVTNDDGTVFVPPSGYVAGVYARVDATRGVHKAPANEVVRGAVGLSTAVTKAAQGGLNDDNVNVIRTLRSGIRIYGARTRSSATEWRYVSSRRTFDFIRESIDEGLQWAVFEPNAEELWAKIRRNVTAFLTTVWASGALFGTTPEEAFWVACDETTNRPSERDLGRVVTRVGVALVRPAEFVVFRISQMSGPGS